jgi:hypothetical protein
VISLMKCIDRNNCKSEDDMVQKLINEWKKIDQTQMKNKNKKKDDRKQNAIEEERTKRKKKYKNSRI